VQRRRGLRWVWPAIAGVAATLFLAAGLWTAFGPAHAPQAAGLSTREMLKGYLSASGTRVRTLAQREAFHHAYSDNPAYLAWGDRFVEGLRKAGLPEK
jgi:hypothetical protein